MNLASILTESAARNPDHPAVRLDDTELTYAQLDGASAHVAGLLHEHGFSQGDRVGIMLPNVPYFPVCYYGILRAGGVVVPMRDGRSLVDGWQNVLARGAQGLGDRARARIESNYSLDLMRARYAALYQSIAATGQVPSA